MSELSLYNATDDTFHLPIYAGKVEVTEMLRTALVHGIWTGIILVLAIAMVVVTAPSLAVLCDPGQADRRCQCMLKRRR